MRAVDIIQPDVLYLGGKCRTLRVVEMGAAAGLPVILHCANLSLVTMFTMHLLRAVPNAGKYLEFSIERADYYPWPIGASDYPPFRRSQSSARARALASASSLSPRSASLCSASSFCFGRFPSAVSEARTK